MEKPVRRKGRKIDSRGYRSRGMKVFSYTGMAFVAVFAIIAIFGMFSYADAAKTDAGVVNARATSNTAIIVKMPYTNNNTVTFTVDHRPCTGGSWTNDVTNSPNVPSPFSTTITVTGAGCWEIRGTYTDGTNGVNGINPQTIRITTPWDTTLLHNSNRFVGTTKWSGSWGVAGGQYGQIDCGTCHTPRATNIKGVASTVETPDHTNWSSTGTSMATVTFGSMTTSANDFGDDSDNHTTSTRVCEVCHSATAHHRYNTTAQTDGKGHYNNEDCTTCHLHNAGFFYATTSCTSCHGNPPNDNSAGGPNGVATPATGATSPTSPGAHVVHATTKNMKCETCHTGTGMPTVDNKIQIGFSGNSTNVPGWDASSSFTGGTLAGNNSLLNSYTWDAAAGTTVNPVGTYGNNCSSLYCHGGGTSGKAALGGGSNSTPSWVGGSGEAACGTCHGADTAASNPASYPAAASHGTHAGTLDLGCTTCHPTVTNNSHVNGSVAWSISTTDARTNGGTYNGTATGDTHALAPSTTYQSCASIYCHSDVQGAGGTGSPTTKTAQWGNTGSITCASCHKDMSSDATAPGKHVKHAQTYGYTCDTCHTGAGTGTNKHADRNIDVVFSTMNPSGTYSQMPANTPGNGYGTCSVLYCHSNAQSSPTYTTADWAGSLDATCTSCHGGNAAATTKMTSNAHASHTNDTGNHVGRNIGCAECHSATASADRTIVNPSGYTIHTNKTINVRFDNGTLVKNSDSPTYNSQDASTNSSTGGTKTPGGAEASCANVYCHSTGNVNNAGSAVPPTTFRTIAWNTGTIGCDGCHGDQAGKAHPTYTNGGVAMNTANSHVKHVDDNLYSCDYCHKTTTTDTSIPPTTVVPTGSGGTHINRSDDVSFKTVGGSTGSYTANTKSCSSTYCHKGVAPQWGDNGSIDCASCHNASNASPGLSSGHFKHYNSTNLPTAIVTTTAHTGTEYVYGCGTCHPSNTHAQGPADGTGPVLQDAQIMTGSVPTKIQTYTQGGTSTTDNKGFNYTQSSTCTNVCHTRDGASASPVVAANWATSPTGACNVCHNASGNNYSFMTTNANRLSDRHAMHMATDRYGANSNLGCNTCHSVTAQNNTTINGQAGRNQHPNTTKNVDFNTTITGSAASWSGTQCTNTYCHSNGQSLTGSHGVITWAGAAGTLPCSSCHGDSASLSSGSHTTHLGISGVTCAYCHNATATGSTAINSYTNHVNKSVTINFNATAASSSSATYNGNTAGGATVYQKAIATAYGTCATTLCHGSGSSTWGTDLSTWATCVKCHGISNSSPANYTADTKRAAPGYTAASAPTGPGRSTAGNTGAGDAKVGAHDAHLRAVDGISSSIACIECHSNVNTGSVTFTGHMNGVGNLDWGTLATLSGAKTPSYSAPNCQTTYCHSANRPAGAGAGQGGLDTAVAWNNTTYIGNTTLTDSCVNKCHAMPPGAGISGDSHFTVSSVSGSLGANVLSTCSASGTGCHSTLNVGSTTTVAALFADSTKHINGTVEVSGCGGCHSFDVDYSGGGGYSGGVWDGGTWGKNYQDGTVHEGWGAHAKHINHLKTVLGYSADLTQPSNYGTGDAQAVCGTCHTNASGNHTMGGSLTRTINFGDGSATYQFGSSAPYYNGVSGTSSTANPKSCSNVSCHFQETPVWTAY